MQLTSVIIELGRAVAYYPGLKKVTGSTTGTVLLCQFLYWHGKTNDPQKWIYKTSDEIEEETGLTYNEQKTARDKLEELGIIIHEFKRLDHTSRYKVMEDVLNSLWEDATGKQSAKIVLPDEDSAQPEVTSPVRREKKGDMLDGMIAFANSPAAKKAEALKEIDERVRKYFNVNTYGKAWEKFVEFVYKQEKAGEKLEVFANYAHSNGYSPIYFPPAKLMVMWPQAFSQAVIPERADEDFVKPLPQQNKEEENYVSAKDMLKRN